MAVAALIGDVVASRRSPDRADLHAIIVRVLAGINRGVDAGGGGAPTTPLRLTVGDEFQGTFATVGEAVRATLRLRVALLPTHDVRHGIGWGRVEVLDEDPRVEDGSAWWAAREAIGVVEAAERRPASRSRRSCYRRAEGEDAGPEVAWVEAVLDLRDELVGRLDARSLSVLRGLLDGTTQRGIAHSLGISASAVSQRVRADGLATILASDRLLRDGAGPGAGSVGDRRGGER